MPKILLVEDDNNLREIFEMRLKAEGYSTITAGNGEEALVVAMKEKPDLIIADVMMPKLSGFEMLETLRATPEMAQTKAIMMTALGQAEDRARGERLGVIKYLVKSQVTLEDFVRVVREVISPAPSGDAAATPTSPSSNKVQPNKESEVNVPEDTSTNPMPPAQGDGSSVNPVSGAPSEPATSQPTTEQEQSAVQDQINNFVSSAPAGGADSAAPAAGAMGGSGDDTSATTAPAMPGAAPSMPTTSVPVTDGTDTSTPSMPTSTPPAEPAPEPPVADSGTTPPAAPAGPASGTL